MLSSETGKVAGRKLSILMPCYNEERLLHKILRKVIDAPIPDTIEKEIIVVDDHSTDQSTEVLMSFIHEHPGVNIQYFRQPHNKGKGAAVRLAIEFQNEVPGQ